MEILTKATMSPSRNGSNVIMKPGITSLMVIAVAMTKPDHTNIASFMENVIALI